MIAETKIVGVLSAYLFMGVNGYYFMKIDKKAAREDQLRISEAALIAIGFMCGWLGIFIAMKSFKHKTKKTEFKIFLKLAALFNIMVLWIYLSLA